MYGWGTRFLTIAAAEAIVGWTGVASGDDDFVAAVLSVPLGGPAERSGATWRRWNDRSRRTPDSSVASWHGDEAVGRDADPGGKRSVSVPGTYRSSLLSRRS
jgi:hypothetical protein